MFWKHSPRTPRDAQILACVSSLLSTFGPVCLHSCQRWSHARSHLSIYFTVHFQFGWLHVWGVKSLYFMTILFLNFGETAKLPLIFLLNHSVPLISGLYGIRIFNWSFLYFLLSWHHATFIFNLNHYVLFVFFTGCPFKNYYEGLEKWLSG